jgi:hypothetical protein
MDKAISSLEKLIWFIFKGIYILIPPIIFLFSISIIIKKCLPSRFSTFFTGFMDYLQKLYHTDKLISFILVGSACAVTGLVTEAVCNVIDWEKHPFSKSPKTEENDTNRISNNESKNQNTNKNNSQPYLEMIKVKIDGDLTAKDVGYSDLTGIKIINEYHNFNSFTEFLAATRTMLLAIYIYINIYLSLFVPYLLTCQFSIPPGWCFAGSFIEVACLFYLFILTRYLYSKLKGKTSNWHDKVISEHGETWRILVLPILLAFFIFFIVSFFPECKVCAFFILIAITSILFPFMFCIVLGANNLQNRIRKMMDSAFIQLRYNDVIFKEGRKTQNDLDINENRN